MPTTGSPFFHSPLPVGGDSRVPSRSEHPGLGSGSLAPWGRLPNRRPSFISGLLTALRSFIRGLCFMSVSCWTHGSLKPTRSGSRPGGPADGRHFESCCCSSSRSDDTGLGFPSGPRGCPSVWGASLAADSSAGPRLCTFTKSFVSEGALLRDSPLSGCPSCLPAWAGSSWCWDSSRVGDRPPPGAPPSSAGSPPSLSLRVVLAPEGAEPWHPRAAAVQGFACGDLPSPRPRAGGRVPWCSVRLGWVPQLPAEAAAPRLCQFTIGGKGAISQRLDCVTGGPGTGVGTRGRGNAGAFAPSGKPASSQEAGSLREMTSSCPVLRQDRRGRPEGTP